MAGKLTPRGHEQLVRLSSYMSFEQAVELFEDFTGIDVSKDVGKRYTEEAGAAYEELQAEEVEEMRVTFEAPSEEASPLTYIAWSFKEWRRG